MRQVILGIAGLSCVLLAFVDHLSAVQPAWRPLAVDEVAQCRGGQFCNTYNIPNPCPANCSNNAGPCSANACIPNVGCVVADVAQIHKTQYYSSCLFGDTGKLSCSATGNYCNTRMTCKNLPCVLDPNNNSVCQNDTPWPCANGQTNWIPAGGDCTGYGRTRQRTSSPVAVINGSGFNVFDGLPDDR